MKTWERKGYDVVERHAGQFEVFIHVDDNDVDPLTTIVGNRDEIIEALDNGADIDDWEDGAGNPIPLHWDDEKEKFVDSRD